MPIGPEHGNHRASHRRRALHAKSVGVQIVSSYSPGDALRPARTARRDLVEWVLDLARVLRAVAH